MSLLSQVACGPCGEGAPPVTDEELMLLHPLVPSWVIAREDGRRKLRNFFEFDDQDAQREFVRHLTEVSKREGHEPEIKATDRGVAVTAWTPAIGDLHPNDFIIAAKADGIYTFVTVGSEGDMITASPLPKLEDLPRFRYVFLKRAG